MAEYVARNKKWETFIR